MSISLSNKSKILIIRLSSIGDIVVCTPIIRCIKKQIGCQIHFLQKARFKEVLSANPYIDKHYYLEDARLKESLKCEGYDLVIDLHKNLRTTKIKSWLPVKSISYNKVNIEKFLLVNFKLNRMPNEHLVDRYFKAVKDLGVVNDGGGLDFFVGDTGPFKAIRDKYIALVIGAAHYTKQIPLELCNKIIRLSKTKIVLLGGKAEVTKSEKLFSDNDQLENYVGKLTLHESAMMIKGASVVITGDTGLMHISAAMQRPIVSVWGSTAPAFGMYPYYGQADHKESRVQLEQLKCRPCTKIGNAKCPKGHFKCMMNLSANDIILKTNDHLLRN